jgi:hypothetical protein
VRELAPLPTVHASARNGGISFEAWWERYRALPKRPLLVRGYLVTPYLPTDASGALHLDALLSYAVLAAFPRPPHFSAPACVVPLPLECLGVYDGPEDERLPLWAASDLLPQGAALRDRAYWHKRYPVDRADFGSRVSANARAGRYKEYRVPLATLHAPEVRGLCIGHEATVRDLLTHVTHVGKKNSQGYGRVARWEVVALERPISEVKPAILLERPVPMEYPKLEPGTYLPRTAWTPPYWYAPWWRACRVRS